jgi:hypothetical protein
MALAPRPALTEPALALFAALAAPSALAAPQSAPAPPASPAPTSPKAPACAADAQARAAKLLALHAESDERASVDPRVNRAAPVARPRGKGRLEVLEVTGYVYKATYRMRFLYAQSPGSCALVGQEILELATP